MPFPTIPVRVVGGHQVIRTIFYSQGDNAIEVKAEAYYQLDNGALVHVDAQIGDDVLIGFGSRVLDHHTTIGEGTFIGDFVTIEDSKIGPRCSIGDGVIIRGENILDADCEVGEDAYLGNCNAFAARIQIGSGTIVGRETLSSVESHVFAGPLKNGTVVVNTDTAVHTVN